MDEFFDKPPFRIVLIILTAGIISSLLPLLYFLDLPFPDEILKWSIILFSGFVAGMVARLLLKNSPLGLQFAVAISAIMVNLFILGWLTLNLIGFDWNPTDRLFSSIRWGTELILAGLVAAVTIRAWNTSIPKIRVPSKPTKIKYTPAIKQKKKPGTPSQKNNSKKTGKTSGSAPRIRGNQTGRKKSSPREIIVIPSIHRQNQVERPSHSPIKAIENRFLKIWERARIYKNKISKAPYKSTSSRMIKARKPQMQTPSRIETNNVRLLGEVEHRCPFCLEVVHKNDPRGVKVCPICQTQHHLDCWNITGVCQVPHQSE
jgi:hypothetical protein